jgi:hypothetical protein
MRGKIAGVKSKIFRFKNARNLRPDGLLKVLVLLMGAVIRNINYWEDTHTIHSITFTPVYG